MLPRRLERGEDGSETRADETGRAESTLDRSIAGWYRGASCLRGRGDGAVRSLDRCNVGECCRVGMRRVHGRGDVLGVGCRPSAGGSSGGARRARGCRWFRAAGGGVHTVGAAGTVVHTEGTVRARPGRRAALLAGGRVVAETVLGAGGVTA